MGREIALSRAKRETLASETQAASNRVKESEVWVETLRNEALVAQAVFEEAEEEINCMQEVMRRQPNLIQCPHLQWMILIFRATYLPVLTTFCPVIQSLWQVMRQQMDLETTKKNDHSMALTTPQQLP